MTLHDTLLLVVGAFAVFTMGFLIGFMLRSVIAYKLFFSRLCSVYGRKRGFHSGQRPPWYMGAATMSQRTRKAMHMTALAFAGRRRGPQQEPRAAVLQAREPCRRQAKAHGAGARLAALRLLHRRACAAAQWHH
jgi:hypothetical protein